MDNDNSDKHILLIEDDPDLADLIGEYLGMNYYEVHHTPTATEGCPEWTWAHSAACALTAWRP